MQPTNFKRAGIFALILSIIVIISWESHLRNIGAPISYDDNEALWSNKRAMVYEPPDQATVFIGASRIKYDLDNPTWVSLTGDHAIQLANLGSSPKAVLVDLANDINFKGKLIIDVTEGIFFSDFSPRDVETISKIAYYHHITPTQRFSFQVDRVLESQFVFLDQGQFSLNAMLDQVKFPVRDARFHMPLFPFEFTGERETRQSFMTARFVADTNLQNQVKEIWAGFGRNGGPPPPAGLALDSILNYIKSLTDKIKARGGQVIFVRTPSSGAFWMGEMKGFPRAAYWDRLLEVTGCEGIHFKDYPETAALICPEWSHLSPADALLWTKTMIKALHENKGWTFKNFPGKS